MAIQQDREQLLLELINRARLDPAAEAARYGLSDLSLDTGTTITAAAKPVLAYNSALYNSATSHNQYMVSQDVFSHTGAGGSTPSQRIAAAGYTANAPYGYWTGENLAYIPFNGVLDGTSATYEAHELLFLSAGHRRNILRTEFKEAGTSVLVDSDAGSIPAVLTTNNFGAIMSNPANPDPGIVTGVNYADLNNDDFYSVGESAAGRDVKIYSGATLVGSSTTAVAGGYQIKPTSKGPVEVVFANGGLAGEKGVQINLGTSNVKVDLTDGSTIETNVSATLTRGAANLTLLSIDNIDGTGNALANILKGNKANNILDGGDGQDTFDGGAGRDVVTYRNASQAITLNLAVVSGLSNTGDAFGETYAGIEEFRLSDFADTFVGSAQSDTVLGGAGGDTLSGGGGADLIVADGSQLPTANANQIIRLYLATLGRGPDDAGLAAWTAQRDSGVALNTIATGFVNSAEFQAKYGLLNNTAFVNLLYNNVLHRAPDSAGLQGWVNVLNGGGSRESVVTGFSESTEFIRTSDPEIHAGQIYRLYGATLDRQPDPAGLAGWTNSLDNGSGIQDVAAGFVGSAEFQNNYGALDNSEFVTLLYNNVIGRAPDANGLSNWVNALNNGATRTSVVVGFSESAEYIANVASPLNDFMQTVQPTWNDTINGGSGNDYMAGGHGADTFVFNIADKGVDNVFGLETWDTVQLNGFGYANQAEALSHVTTSGSNVVFMDQGETITFHQTTLAELSNTNWLLA